MSRDVPVKSSDNLKLASAGLDLPHQGADPALDRIIEGYIRRHKGLGRPAAKSPPNGWFSPALYQYDRLSTWDGLTETVRTYALTRAARGTMREAYFIEKSGLAYGARMLLVSETTERRQAYGLLLADEASHLNWVAQFLGLQEREGPMDSFTTLLGDMVATGPPMVLVFVLQILLEGWGVDHYRRLAAHALDDDVARMCQAIFRDESLHHRTGEVMFDARQLSDNEREIVRGVTAGFLDIVRAGPLSALDALEQACGGFDAATATTVIEELEGGGETRRKLDLLCGLMAVEGMDWLVADCRALNLFEPLSAVEMAARRLSGGPG